MPRKTEPQAAKFPSEMQYRGLTPIITEIATIPPSVDKVADAQEEGNTELERIRRGSELIVGTDIVVEDEGEE